MPSRKGDKIAQLLQHPFLASEVVEGELSDAARGAKGFGSSGSVETAAVARPHRYKATCDKKPEHMLWLGLAESSYIYYAR